MMNIHRNTLILLFFFTLVGCTNSKSIVLKADEEAIITQEGRIVKSIEGPKVQKIPSKQNAHIIRTHLIRIYKYDSFPIKTFSTTVRWNVLDSISYYQFSKDIRTENIKEILKSELEKAIAPYDISQIQKIAENQKTNKQYADKCSQDIFKNLQFEVNKFGMEIHHIFYAEKN